MTIILHDRTTKIANKGMSGLAYDRALGGCHGNSLPILLEGPVLAIKIRGWRWLVPVALRVEGPPPLRAILVVKTKRSILLSLLDNVCQFLHLLLKLSILSNSFLEPEVASINLQ